MKKKKVIRFPTVEEKKTTHTHKAECFTVEVPFQRFQKGLTPHSTGRQSKGAGPTGLCKPPLHSAHLRYETENGKVA